MQKNKFKSFSRFATHLVSIVCLVSFFNVSAAAAYRPVLDFTGDARTDFSYVVQGTSAGAQHQWRFLRNPGIPGPGNAFIRTFNFGVNPDIFVPGDYYGDSKTEIAIRRPSDNLFYETAFPETAVAPVVYESWGQAGDNFGRDGDYDGDGKDDETVIRITASQLQWWVKGSAGTNRVTTYGRTAAGISTFAFPGADFTGDGREEFIVAEVAGSTGAVTWFVGDSISGAQVLQVQWGNFNLDYVITPDDYTGDGIADIPVWRGATTGRPDAGYWFIRNTATGALVPSVKFGIEGLTGGDLPLRGNYDGDQKADIAVWRPSTQTWYWINSSDGTLGVQQWGDANTNIPLPNFFTF